MLRKSCWARETRIQSRTSVSSRSAIYFTLLASSSGRTNKVSNSHLEPLALTTGLSVDRLVSVTIPTEFTSADDLRKTFHPDSYSPHNPVSCGTLEVPGRSAFGFKAPSTCCFGNRLFYQKALCTYACPASPMEIGVADLVLGPAFPAFLDEYADSYTPC